MTDLRERGNKEKKEMAERGCRFKTEVTPGPNKLILYRLVADAAPISFGKTMSSYDLLKRKDDTLLPLPQLRRQNNAVHTLDQTRSVASENS